MAKTTTRTRKSPPKTDAPTGKIDLETLHRKLADPKTSEAALRKYFVIDEARSGPFTPQLGLNPATVEIPPTPEGRARGDMAIASANWWCRMRRTALFNTRIAEGYRGAIVVSEGDSWFQYPMLLDDVIDQLIAKGYAIRSLDGAGDTLEDMIRSGEYLDGLRQTGASVFLFSAGGNDILGGGNLASMLRDYDPALSPAQHILPAFQTLLDQAIAGYDKILRGVEALPGDILTLCHGYDRPLPNKGKWLGLPMETRGIKDRNVQREIAGVMIDRFNTALAKLTAGFAHVSYLDVRGVVGPKPKRWYDELHPVNKAYAAVADRFDAAIRAAHPRSFAAKPAPGARPSLAVKVEDRPSATPAARKVAKPSVTKQSIPKKRRGLSLHVGLNEIDPKHYGSNGALNACIADAEAMKGLAEAQGFDVMGLLINGEGKRSAVIKAIAQAAKDLRSGDIFLYTYSGHGSQLPDFNKDETDSFDETWCLFDGMFLDDEAYRLWGQFREGVRIFVLLDCCHSGSAIRNAPDLFTGADAARNGHKARMLPLSVAARAFQNNRAFYEKIGKGRGQDPDSALPDDVALRPEAADVRCSVRLISGCQDNQLSMDGFFNGRFTEELLRVWDSGRFKGDYAKFHKKIVSGMPPTQTPNHYQVGVNDPAFDAQAPFTI
jgi:hypothetical protein